MLVFADSFDHYDTVLRKYSAASGALVSLSIGRNATNGMRCGDGGGGSFTHFQKNTLGGRTTLTLGFAVKTSDVSRPFGVQLYDVTSVPSSTFTQISLELNPASFALLVRRGGPVISGFSDFSGGTILAQGNTPLASGAFNYIEIKVVCHPSAGSVEVRLNGALEISFSGNTQGSTIMNLDAFRFLGGRNVANVDFDDLYVTDTAGGVNTGFLGDVRVEALFPNGAGATTQWTPFPAPPNFAAVDEPVFVNEDTDYVFTDVVNNIDTYGFGNISPASASIKAVVHAIRARKEDAGDRRIAAVSRQGGTDFVSAEQAVTTAYAYYLTNKDLNPATGLAWTLAEVNAGEFGFKITL